MIMDFIRDWQPDLIAALVILIGGLVHIFVAPIFAKGKIVTRWRIGGIFTALSGFILLAIRFI